MKLELKHLAPYLPYGLKCKVDNDKIISTIIGIEKGYEDKYGWFWITCAKRFANGTSFNRQSSNIIKPILHPLSDLTKPIKVEGYNDGKEFVPIVEMAKIADCHFKFIPDVKEIKEFKEDGCNIIQVHYVDDRNPYFEFSYSIEDSGFRENNDGFTMTLNILNAVHNPYTIVKRLYQWHFDLEGLIESV